VAKLCAFNQIAEVGKHEQIVSINSADNSDSGGCMCSSPTGNLTPDYLLSRLPARPPDSATGDNAGPGAPLARQILSCAVRTA
jgi:hypothetical protein